MSRRPALVRANLSIPASPRVSGPSGRLTITRAEATPHGVIVTCERDDGEWFELPLHEAFSLVDTATEDPVLDWGPARHDWHLTPQDESRITTIHRAVATVMTGDPDYDVFLAGTRRGLNVLPQFDPATVDLETRIALIKPRMQEAGVSWSRRSYFRYKKVLEKDGPGALLHGNKADLSAERFREAEPALWVAVDDFAASRATEPTITKQAFRMLCRIRLDEQDIDRTCVSDAGLHRLMDFMFHKHRLDQPYKTRQSRAVSKAGKQGTWACPDPYRIVQMDATPLDLFCLDDKGEVIERVHVVVAIDTASRMVLGMDFFVGTFTSRDVQRLLFRMVQGWAIPGALDPSLPAVPERIEVSIGGVLLDRGSQFVSKSSLAVFTRVGVDVSIAPPGRGDAKGIVESFLRTVGLISQTLPGHKGVDQLSRGRDSGRSHMLLLDELKTVLWEWVATCYHTRPHRALTIPGTKRQISPNDWMAHYVANVGEIHVDRDQRKMLALMDRDERTVSNRGVLVNGQYFDHAPESLAELADTHSGRRGRRAQHVVHVYRSGANPRAVLVQVRPGEPLLVCVPDPDLPQPPMQDLIDDAWREWMVDAEPEASTRAATKKAETELVRAAQQAAKKPGRVLRTPIAPPPQGKAASELVDPDWFRRPVGPS